MYPRGKLTPRRSVRNFSFTKSLIIFAVFAAYGPSFSFAGQLRYVELAIVFYFFAFIGSINRYLSSTEKIQIVLFLTTALFYCVSDYVNGAEISGTIKRGGSYLLMALLVVSLSRLVGASFQRLIALVLGYCVSYVFILYVGTQTSSAYHLVPWRLGLGAAVSMFALALIAHFRVRPPLSLLIVLIISILHIQLGSRSLALITILVFLFGVLSSTVKKRALIKVSAGHVVLFVVSGTLLAVATYSLAKTLVDQQLLPAELQARMEIQLSNPHGLLAAARPDTATAIYAISKRPMIGYGSTIVDPEVYSYYVELAAASYLSSDQHDNVLNAMLDAEWDLGTPNHSLLFGAWADAGIVASLAWFSVLAFLFRVLMKIAFWDDPFCLLVVFAALSLAWDVLLSPGPHRMDIAVKLTIVFWAYKRYAINFFGGPYENSVSRQFYEARSAQK